jgi:hypothetical protein
MCQNLVHKLLAEILGFYTQQNHSTNDLLMMCHVAVVLYLAVKINEDELLLLLLLSVAKPIEQGK